MPSRLQEEIQQSRAFESLRQEAMLQVARSAAVLTHTWEQSLRPHGVTATQYNVLRILRGAGEPGLPRTQIAVRLITPVPDVSRLLDRLMHAGLITRSRGTDDRRTIRARITAAGLTLLQQLDALAVEMPERQLGHLSDDQVRRLIELLEATRCPANLPEPASH